METEGRIVVAREQGRELLNEFLFEMMKKF